MRACVRERDRQKERERCTSVSQNEQVVCETVGGNDHCYKKN